MDNEDDLIPQLAAYRHRGRFKAWCCFCETWHHWFSLGRVQGKCPQFSPNSGHVELIDAGPWSPMKVVRYSNRKV
jgi:hypothetical protein